MSSKQQAHRKFETVLERKANRAFKLHAREVKESQISPHIRGGKFIINTNEDDFSDIDEMFEEEDLEE